MQSAARKQFTLNAPPFAGELNDYEDDDDEEYEGVDGGALDSEDRDPGDDSSMLAEQLGVSLRTSATATPSSDFEDEKLLDLLQKRLFVASDDPEAEEDEQIYKSRRESLSPRRKSSITSQLEDFLADRASKQKSLKQKMGQDAQRALLDTFSKEPNLQPKDENRRRRRTTSFASLLP
ncbi:unnamed protein product [Phytophthora fragariaefolia]|uniref:Unnamed protein product n=1 Tax=Phytophthora fragariaefolia TaxID=1490495 RepID=A0A9W6YEY6_9STRA|nr:unnamed protein product [Phytophthora fragariaefolia]